MRVIGNVVACDAVRICCHSRPTDILAASYPEHREGRGSRWGGPSRHPPPSILKRAVLGNDPVDIAGLNAGDPLAAETSQNGGDLGIELHPVWALVLGDTGVGKELAQRHLQRIGNRDQRVQRGQGLGTLGIRDRLGGPAYGLGQLRLAHVPGLAEGPHLSRNEVLEVLSMKPD